MNRTKQTILNELRRGPQTSYALSNVTDRPQPSVRRSIGELRVAGYNIVSAGTGLDATYRLFYTPPVAQADGDNGEGEDSAFDTNIDAGDQR